MIVSGSVGPRCEWWWGMQVDLPTQQIGTFIYTYLCILISRLRQTTSDGHLSRFVGESVSGVCVRCGRYRGQCFVYSVRVVVCERDIKDWHALARGEDSDSVCTGHRDPPVRTRSAWTPGWCWLRGRHRHRLPVSAAGTSTRRRSPSPPLGMAASSLSLFLLSLVFQDYRNPRALIII